MKIRWTDIALAALVVALVSPPIHGRAGTTRSTLRAASTPRPSNKDALVVLNALEGEGGKASTGAVVQTSGHN